MKVENNCPRFSNNKTWFAVSFIVVKCLEILQFGFLITLTWCIGRELKYTNGITNQKDKLGMHILSLEMTWTSTIGKTCNLECNEMFIENS